jgi:hypothetical protein
VSRLLIYNATMKSYHQIYPLSYLLSRAVQVWREWRFPARNNLLIAGVFFLLVLTAAFISSCSVLDALNATPAPILLTETPLPTATIDWFPASVTPTQGVFSTPNPPTPEMRPGLGANYLTDDFSDPALWDTAKSDQASAEIDDNRLNLSAENKVYMISLRHELTASDYYAEITARPGLCRGDDSYGLLVRANAISYYRFSLTCNGAAFAERINIGTHELLQKPLSSSDVPPGAPGEVRIGIWAVGPEMRLFLNGRYQFSVNNSNYPSGTIGVFVNSAGNSPVIVSFSRLTLQKVNYIAPTKTPKPYVTATSKNKTIPKP